MYETSAIKKTGCYSILSFVFLFYLCNLFVPFTEAAVINSRKPHRPQSVLTTQLLHNLLCYNSSIPCSQQTPPDPTVRKYEITQCTLNFTLILLSNLFLSLQKSVVPSGLLPTTLCYSHFPMHCMSTSM